MLHEVAPSLPLSSLSLLSSSEMIMVSASVVFRSRRSKNMFYFSKWNTHTLVLAQRSPLPTVRIPAGLFASGTDVALARVYLYLHIRHSLRCDSARSWESEFPLQISLVIIGSQAHVVWELLLESSSPPRWMSLTCTASFPDNTAAVGTLPWCFELLFSWWSFLR